MTRASIIGALFCLSLTAVPSALSARPARDAAAQAPVVEAVTPANAAAFLGDWSLEMDQGTMGLTVKADQGKVVAEFANSGLPTGPISTVQLVDKSLAITYGFEYQGNQVTAVLYLTPGAQGAVAAQIDFANGAFVMPGKAVKKAATPAPPKSN